MSFGRMTEFIDIIETVQTKDAEGFSTSTETVVASVRACFEQRHGTKVWANRAAFSTATCLFRFRVIPGLTVTPSMLISCRGERYRILSAENVRGRNMYIEILADVVSAVKGK